MIQRLPMNAAQEIAVAYVPIQITTKPHPARHTLQPLRSSLLRTLTINLHRFDAWRQRSR
jgi:hypothetical protein